MQRKYIKSIASILFCITHFCSAISCNNKNIHFSNNPTTFSILKGQKTTLYIDNKEVGFLSYVKIPSCNWYVFYSFFIKKEYRNNSYGKQLFENMLDEITSKGNCKIFIQPGPFEIINDKFIAIKGSEKEEKINKLVQFYESFNFNLTNNKPLSIFLSLLYKILGIHENPKFFMMYEN